MQAGLTPAMRTSGSGLSQRSGRPEVTPMPEASFPVQVVGGVPVVTAPEEIDITNAAGLRAVLLEATGHGSRTLVVDMAQTQFCDSAGLHVLVRAHKRAQAEGGELLLVICAAAVLRIFAVTGIDHLIPNFPTLEQALAPVPAVPDFTSPPGALASGPAATAAAETLETP
jgi:anti-anti-sigma factor